jgi:uncharacterized protein YdhG (YjbR/CyaY superfamily)
MSEVSEDARVRLGGARETVMVHPRRRSLHAGRVHGAHSADRARSHQIVSTASTAECKLPDPVTALASGTVPRPNFRLERSAGSSCRVRGVEEPKRSTLQAPRRMILDVIPDAEQGISYGMPAFRSHGKTVASFAAFKDHLSYLPHSVTVLGQLADDLAGYTMTKGSLHFLVDRHLPQAVVKKLIAVRLSEADRRSR